MDVSPPREPHGCKGQSGLSDIGNDYVSAPRSCGVKFRSAMARSSSSPGPPITVSRGLTRGTADGAPVALPFPENITRKVNQYRGFIGYRHPHFLKGRFILNGTGRVEWIHRPQVDTRIRHILPSRSGAARIFVARHA